MRFFANNPNPDAYYEPNSLQNPTDRPMRRRFMPNRSLPLGLLALALSLSVPALAADDVKIDDRVVAATISDARHEVMLLAAEASAQTTKPAVAHNVVLVHGA